MADITKINVNGTDYDIKDANAITTESDPTVPSWAKQSTKPSYDAQEIYAQYTGGYGQATYVQDALDDIHDYKQDTLVSGTNLKTVNNESLLGSGNITIEGGSGTVIYDGDSTTDTPYDNLFMDTVASGVESLIVGGITISEPPLWENGSPTSSYGATTAEFNSDGYEVLYLIYVGATGSGFNSVYFPITLVKRDFKYGSSVVVADILRLRYATWKNNGIEFTNCNRYRTYGTPETDNTCLIPYRVYGIRSATAISTSLQHIFPDYNVSQTLNSGSSSGATTFTGTITEAGYLQARINVTATAGNNFVRVKINGSTIWEKQDKVSQNYVYTWSPMFYVKAGDTYSVELDSGSGSCNKYVYFYGLR